MKLKSNVFRLLTLLVVPLTLASCSEPAVSSTESSSQADSTLTSTPTSTPSSTPVSTPASDSLDSSVTSSDGAGDTEEPDDGIIDAADSPWSDEITAMMTKDLGGTILPYVDLGNGEIKAEYVEDNPDDNYRSSLVLTGGKYMASNLNDAVTEYKNHGWEAMTVNGGFYAKRQSLGVEVLVTKTSDGLFCLRAYWSEAYDPSALTDWTAETKTQITDRFGRFTVPFTYLGTVNYRSSIDDGVFTVIGGTWDDQVLSSFRSSYTGWTITTSPDSLTTLIATLNDADGSVMTATLDDYTNKARLRVTLDEKFDDKNVSAWPSDVITSMKGSLNQNVIPFVYLGTTYPRATDIGARSLTIKGNLWNDSILDSAKSTFAAAGWTSAPSASDSSSLEFSKDTGKETLKVVIGKDEDDVPVLTASRTENYNESTLTSWPSDISARFATEFPNNSIDSIPFVYLGTEFPTVNEDFTSPKDNASLAALDRLVITGGSYDERILNNFKAKYGENSGWIATFDTDLGNSSGSTNSGTVLGTALKEIGDYTFKVSLFNYGEGAEETVYLEITRSENKAVSTAWSTDAISNIHKVLGSDVSIPFFDVGRTDKDVIINSDGELEFNFDNLAQYLNYRIISAYNALKADGWTIKLYHISNYYHNEAWISDFVATKAFGNKTVKFEIRTNSSSYYIYNIQATAMVEETYDKENNAATDWSEDIKNTVKNQYGVDLPYVYLGTANPFIYENKDEGTTMIYGNVYNDQIVSDAREAFVSNGWTIEEQADSDYIVFSITNSNLDKITATIYHSYGDVNHPYIELSKTESFSSGASGAWSDAVKEDFSQYLNGNEIPYIYVGTESPSITCNYGYNTNLVSFVGSDWSDDMMDYAKNVLPASEWHTVLVDDYWDPEVTAYKFLGDNTALRIHLYKNSDDLIQLDIFYDGARETPLEVSSWDDLSDPDEDSLTDTISNKFDGFVPNPFIFAESNGSYPSTGSSSFYSNKVLSIDNYDAGLSATDVYSSMSTLESNGFDITEFDPFAEGDMPGFSASKYDEEKGYTLEISFSSASYDSAYDSEANGYDITMLYLPPYSDYTATDWNSDAKSAISNNLAGLELPYVNLGAEPDVSGNGDSVNITAANYNEDVLASIKDAYEADGWTINYCYTVSGGEATKGLTGYLEKDGHLYVINVSHYISFPIVRTEIDIEMF